MTRQVQTILVADDEWEVRELVRTILEWEDYAVVEAKDGEDALAQARAIQPDLILLDVRMPKMNGLDVLEYLQADPALASIPVVMLSVLTNYPQVGTALRNGAIAYLPKPFEIPDLARMVKRVLSGDAARREAIRQHAVKSLIESW
ncbi:MAG: response regulator [Anaerolineae bacterium]|jgi:CheY-like chemotaxis protein